MALERVLLLTQDRWDSALRASSGLHLGILGFLLVYAMNESKRIDLHLQAGLVALLAFKQVFGTTMPKPTLGYSSGLTDARWDLIVDALGCARRQRIQLVAHETQQPLVRRRVDRPVHQTQLTPVQRLTTDAQSKCHGRSSARRY